MLWIAIGHRVHAPTERARTRVTGEWSLHFQCPWRLSGPDGIVTGSGDIFECANPSAASSFDPHRPGDAVADVRLRAWLDARANQPATIVGVDGDRCGGLCLQLTGDFRFEAFPETTAVPERFGEYWRLLRPGRDASHFVVRSCGIEEGQCAMRRC
ncbi:MAG TPA: hypothetical protein VG736_08155 [Vicinamibacterales bacterium]|nr:hypothetical protein [Vicinamibacterales bacterium]